MPQFSPEQMAKAQSLATAIAAKIRANPGLPARIQARGDHAFLKDSEVKFRQQMEFRNSPARQPGVVEFGSMLLRTARDFPELHRAMALPSATLSEAELDLHQLALDASGIVSGEGDIIGTGKYEQLDPGWALALLHHWATLIGVYSTASFGTTPARIKLSGPLKIALVGDWGTGVWDDEGLVCPAVQVMEQIARLKPDITIHLGDVYYSGTTGEEQENYLANWLSPSPYNFSLNSNHEMYDGGNGYFSVLLQDPRFAAQAGTSYFSIETDGFVILGLDTAYYDTSSLLLDGALTDAAQQQFIANTNTSGKKIMVLTHHNGLPLDGSAPTTPLWSQVMASLAPRVPDYWYWGHLHSGIAYSSTAYGDKTRARCLGHGALPTSVPGDLMRGGKLLPSVEYLANTPLQSTNPDQGNRVMNGFALLTLNGSTIREEFYNQAGVVDYSVPAAP